MGWQWGENGVAKSEAMANGRGGFWARNCWGEGARIFSGRGVGIGPVFWGAITWW